MSNPHESSELAESIENQPSIIGVIRTSNLTQTPKKISEFIEQKS